MQYLFFLGWHNNCWIRYLLSGWRNICCSGWRNICYKSRRIICWLGRRNICCSDWRNICCSGWRSCSLKWSPSSRRWRRAPTSCSCRAWRRPSGTGWTPTRRYRLGQCCGSGMFIPDPRSWFLPIPDPGSRILDPGSRISDLGSRISDLGSRIPDPGSKNSYKREGWKNFFCQTFFCSHKFHKMLNYFMFELLKKKNGPNFKELWNFLPKKLSLSSQKYEFGIRDPE